jgi:hypothetical protein
MGGAERRGMTIGRWTALARKAMHRPPRYLAARLAQEARRQARRPWSRVRPRLLTDDALVRATGHASMDALWDALSAAPFFLRASDSTAWRAAFSARFPADAAAIVDAADRVLRHEFDLLGSGPKTFGERLPWHEDFKTGRRWPLQYATDIDCYDLGLPSDVKVPWELSRCQHFTRLGQAYWLTGDERYAREFVAQVDDWIGANPWMFGVNWICAMDVSLRAMSWIWGFHFFAASEACRDAAFRGRFMRALYLHGEFVAGNIELSDVNGNHYLTDGVGLVFLGAFFASSARGRQWLRTGRAIVLDEILLQTSEDGVDFEQSVSYHRLVLEGFLTAYQLLRIHGERIPEPSWRRLERMIEFVAAYTKPDGLAPLVGDADDGRMQSLGVQPINDHRYLLSAGAVMFDRPGFKQAAGAFAGEAFWLLGPSAAAEYDAIDVSSRPCLSSASFPEGGFHVLRGPDTHLFVDGAEVGMRGRGGHGHNDVLSFELFFNGVNLVTDCGAYLYTASVEWRNRFRSTAFHNTIQVDDEELNRPIPDDLWRMQYDAVPVDVSFSEGRSAARFGGAHRGYERLDPPVSHRREIVVDRVQPRVMVTDRVGGSGQRRLTARFHFDPGVRPAPDGTAWRLTSGGREAWLHIVQAPPGTDVSLEPAWVSPSYGRKVESRCLTLRADAGLPATFCCLVAAEPLDAPSAAAARAALENAE